MDTHKHMIIADDKIITRDVRLCNYHEQTHQYELQFYTGKTYTYKEQDILWMQEPEIWDPQLYRIFYMGNELFRISKLFLFEGRGRCYFHICFDDGNEADYKMTQLEIIESCFKDALSVTVFEYLKQAASFNEWYDKDGRKIRNPYEKVNFVGENTALATYLNPRGGYALSEVVTPIFPFGCSDSQYKAVKAALNHSVSVVSGAPGTGKTQTILNIIANLLVHGKTVQVVFRNPSSMESLLEKLSSPQCQLGFLTAFLDNKGKKRAFIKEQTGKYPDLSAWKREEGDISVTKFIGEKSKLLEYVFEKQKKQALLKLELERQELEFRYYEQYLKEKDIIIEEIKFRKQLQVEQFMELWQEFQSIADKGEKINLLFRLKCLFTYGIADWNFYGQDLSKIIAVMQGMFYRIKIEELRESLRSMEEELAENPEDFLVDGVCELSKRYMQDVLYRKYGTKKERKIFIEIDLSRNFQEVLEEYPIVISSVASSRNSLSPNVVFDYLIMDEASQIDVATGALALSCTKNVVVVGDVKQSPNWITGVMKRRSEELLKSSIIAKGYDFAENSFLQSIMRVMTEVPQTLLREHFRCHPKIMQFSNQKFYDNELVILSKDKGEQAVLSLFRTKDVKREEEFYHQSQVDVIKEEVLPRLTTEISKIGIIASCAGQEDIIKKEIKKSSKDTIEVAVVHKYEGREKDTVILSTAEDEITDFATDPYTLNTAVSRAKKQLCVVVSGKKRPVDKNICDLINYIEYQNFEAGKGRIYPVFDYLNKQYTEGRLEYLKVAQRMAEYDAEKLMCTLFTEVLQQKRYAAFGVVCHLPLLMLIRSVELLDNEERAYAADSAAHLDFLIYKRIGMRPALAVEVDGYPSHKDAMIQEKGDKLKKRVLEKYGLPLLRLPMEENGAKQMLLVVLDKMLKL